MFFLTHTSPVFNLPCVMCFIQCFQFWVFREDPCHHCSVYSKARIRYHSPTADAGMYIANSSCIAIPTAPLRGLRYVGKVGIEAWRRW